MADFTTATDLIAAAADTVYVDNEIGGVSIQNVSTNDVLSMEIDVWL